MKCFIATMMIIGIILAPVAAMAAPDLSAPGSFYVDIDNGGNNDGPANGWAYSTFPDFIFENDDYMRYGAGDTEFTMTVSNLTPGAQYDVAVLFADQVGAGYNASWKPVLAGLVSGSLTELSYLNNVEPGVGGNCLATESNGDWYHCQSTNGVIGTGTATGGGTLNIYFDGIPYVDLGGGDFKGGEAMADGVVLAPLGGGGATPGTLIYGK